MFSRDGRGYIPVVVTATEPGNGEGQSFVDRESIVSARVREGAWPDADSSPQHSSCSSAPTRNVLCSVFLILFHMTYVKVQETLKWDHDVGVAA